MNSVPIKRGNLDADIDTRRMPHEHEGRECSDASTGKSTLKIAANH